MRLVRLALRARLRSLSLFFFQCEGLLSLYKQEISLSLQGKEKREWLQLASLWTCLKTNWTGTSKLSSLASEVLFQSGEEKERVMSAGFKYWGNATTAIGTPTKTYTSVNATWLTTELDWTGSIPNDSGTNLLEIEYAICLLACEILLRIACERLLAFLIGKG